jgi:hypothetical protein
MFIEPILGKSMQTYQRQHFDRIPNLNIDLSIQQIATHMIDTNDQRSIKRSCSLNCIPSTNLLHIPSRILDILKQISNGYDVKQIQIDGNQIDPSSNIFATEVGNISSTNVKSTSKHTHNNVNIPEIPIHSDNITTTVDIVSSSPIEPFHVVDISPAFSSELPHQVPPVVPRITSIILPVVDTDEHSDSDDDTFVMHTNSTLH